MEARSHAVSSLRENGFVSTLLGFWAILALGATCIFIILLAPFLGGPGAFRWVTSRFIRHTFWACGIQLHIRGWEDLPEAIRTGRKPVIFMSNHESNFDPPLLIHAIPIQATFISKKEVLWVPLVGWAAWLGNTIFLDRGNRERSRKSLQEAAALIRNGRNVAIFAEGTRTRTGELGEFKKGGFMLAMQAGVVIVPMATVGTFQVLPAGAKRIRPGRVDVRFGQPVEPQDHPTKDTLLAVVREQIVGLKAQILKER